MMHSATMDLTTSVTSTRGSKATLRLMRGSPMDTLSYASFARIARLISGFFFHLAYRGNFVITNN